MQTFTMELARTCLHSHHAGPNPPTKNLWSSQKLSEIVTCTPTQRTISLEPRNRVTALTSFGSGVLHKAPIFPWSGFNRLL